MKKRITYFFLFFLLVILYSCSQVGVTAKENILKNKTYVHLFYSSEKECLENQPEPDFFYNCHQQVDFYKDNIVEIMLTDIIWRGSYQIDNNIVILKFEPNYEIPNGEIKFEVLHSNTLLRLDNHTVWKKLSGNSIWN